MDIQKHSIFGEYKNPEDRVTAALLHLLYYGGMDLVHSLWGDLMDIPSSDLTIRSQVKKGNTRPDGEIFLDCHFHLLIESKIDKDALRRPHDQNQLSGHLQAASFENASLIYLTPDDSCPSELIGKQVVWMNWKDLVQKLNNYATEDRLLQYLISQFWLLVENLVYKNRSASADRCGMEEQSDDTEQDAMDKRVILVGGRWGEDVALNYGFYACQPNRYFKDARYMAFCFDHRIKYLFRIEGTPVEAILLNDSSLGIDPDYFVKKEPAYSLCPSLRKFFRLTLVQQFDPEIVNDKTDAHGKPTAFVQRQTYTTYDRILRATRTSEL
ncbi:MAG: hypothetical protein IJ156_02565 [Bacteroidales bacterium]|nr:hypothetical protein [Bacteroidales bacterium]